MTDKELIKKEIERLKNEQLYIFSKGENEEIYGTALTCIGVYNQLLSFINSLPEEPANEDLEEEIDRYYSDWQFDDDTIYEDMRNICRHFAEWQKQQMNEKFLSFLKDRVQNFVVNTPLYPYFDYKKAIEGFKQAMMEE